MKYIKSRKDIKNFIKGVVDVLGGSFHPDHHFKEYVLYDQNNSILPFNGMQFFHPLTANAMTKILNDCLEFDEDYTWNISIELTEKLLGIKPVKKKYDLETYG